MTASRFRALLPPLLIFAAALAARVAWVLAAEVDPRAKFNLDMTWYDLMGAWLAQGNGYTNFQGEPTAAWPPGYPALLAVLYRLFGNHVVVAQLANAVLGASTGLVVYALGRRLFDARVGLVAAGILALYPGQVMFSALLLSEVLFTFLFATACLLFVLCDTREPAPGPAAWALFGALVGIATLVRGTTLAFAAVPAAIWLLSGRAWKPSAVRLGAVLLGFALVVGPWVVRNRVQMGEFVLLSTNLGRTLSIAHLPDGGDEKRYAALQRSLGEVGLDALRRRDALAHVASHPSGVLERVPLHVLHLYERDDVAMNWGRVPKARGRGVEPLLGSLSDPVVRRIANGLHRGILALAALGLVAALDRRRPERFILPAAILYVTLLHSVVFHGNPRFYVPLAPLVCVLAAVSLVTLRDRLRARRIRSGDGA